jgi:RNA polymerase sigma-70 factor, ECF subfamily
MTTERELEIEEYVGQVYAWAYRLLQNHHDTMDVSQEVSIKWLQVRDQGQRPVNPVAWLRRVTINLAIDTIRVRTRKEQQAHGNQLEASTSDHAAEPVTQETARQIATALGSLTEQQRLVVVAKVYDGYTFAQIAGEMELAVPTVKSHYLRALRKLRIKLTHVQREVGFDYGM